MIKRFAKFYINVELNVLLSKFIWKNTLNKAVGVGFHWLYDLESWKKYKECGFENIKRKNQSLLITSTQLLPQKYSWLVQGNSNLYSVDKALFTLCIRNRLFFLIGLSFTRIRWNNHRQRRRFQATREQYSVVVERKGCKKKKQYKKKQKQKYAGAEERERERERVPRTLHQIPPVLFSLGLFYFRDVPTIWEPGTGYQQSIFSGTPSETIILVNVFSRTFM